MAEPNFKNRTLYHGDNLAFLRGMNSETVHLIATDPPFNKNRDFHATPDSLAKGASFSDRWSWERDVHEEWTDSIIDDWPAVWEVITAARAAYGDSMGAFLCWLGVRLMEMHRILRTDGSIYLHCDQTASHYIKAMMDAIFGWKNFRNEIVWQRTNRGHKGSQFAPRSYSTNTDTLFFYAKSRQFNFHIDRIPIPYDDGYVERTFIHTDRKGRYSRTSPFRRKGAGARPNLCYEYKGINPPYPTGWAVSLDNLKRMDAEGDIEFIDGKVYRKVRPKGGKRRSNLWLFDEIGGTLGSERTGYPTQKPLALYERIIKASSNEGDIVLDPFCGCATTTIAAERLGREWVGMDIWDEAHPVTLKRLAEEGMVTPDSEHNLMFPHIVHYETAPPVRTDDNEVAAPTLKLKIQRPQEPWQRLTHKQMVRVLARAQKSANGVICAGCGRVLEVEFMQLDHITPKSDRGENHILNRILLCGPCNRRKRDNLTLRGLLRENKKKAVGWMKDESMAKLVQEHAREQAEWVRDNFATEDCQALIAGRDGMF